MIRDELVGYNNNNVMCLNGWVVCCVWMQFYQRTVSQWTRSYSDLTSTFCLTMLLVLRTFGSHSALTGLYARFRAFMSLSVLLLFLYQALISYHYSSCSCCCGFSTLRPDPKRLREWEWDHSFIHFWHAPLSVRSVRCREVHRFQVLLGKRVKFW